MLVTLLTLMKVYIIYGFSLPSVQSILHAFARGSVRMMPLGRVTNVKNRLLRIN